MMVDLGPDRFHHACLRHVMAAHPDFAPDDRVFDYYRLLDDELGATLGLAGPDTTVMVVSDHGVKPLHGAVCINELLIREGLLVLRDGPPPAPAPLSALNVNWDRTVAFGEGGYHGRIFLNRTGRDPRGIVTPDRAPAVIDQLRRLLTSLTGPDGRPMHNVVFAPREKYGDAYAGMPPDLTVYFDNLNRRSAGTVGHGTIFLPCNDTGTDHANHDFDGIFALRGPGVQRGERRASILDIFATALHRLGIAAPAGTGGEIL
jgi:predicted AlkP superfamily phosphohydrolase/phosphomutase